MNEVEYFEQVTVIIDELERIAAAEFFDKGCWRMNVRRLNRLNRIGRKNWRGRHWSAIAIIILLCVLVWIVFSILS